MKRYIYIIIGIIVAAVLAILVLFLIKKNSASSSPSITGTTGGSLPAAGTQGSNSSSSVPALGLSTATSGPAAANGQMTVSKFGVLSQDPVLDYFVDAQNNIISIEPTGAIISISDGRSIGVNSSTINDIISAGFSYDGKKILVSFGDPSNPHTNVFNVATNAWTSLPQGMLSPRWSPTNNYQIAYLASVGTGKLALATMDAANPKTKPATLLVLNADDLDLQWPTKSEFILSDKPTLQNAGSIWTFNPSTGTLIPLIYEVTGAESIWSHNAAIPYGLMFFNSPTGQRGNVLRLQALSGNLATQQFNFLTLPSKCAFNTESMSMAASTTSAASSTAQKKTVPASTPYLALYCGVPRSSSGFSSAHLPDDYLTMALFTSDDLYKVDTATGADQVLWSDAGQNMDTSDMKFANNALFFINRYDSKLYGLTFN